MDVGHSLAARTNCFSKEASTGTPDPECHAKASDKFATAFPKLETKYPNTSTSSCVTFGDQGAFETALTDYAASVPVATGSALGVCDAAKIKCVGKYVTAVLKCDSKAAGKTGTIDTKCTGKAVDKLANGAGGCLDKAAQHAGCTNAGNQAVALKGAADQFIQDTVVALASDPRYVDNGDGTVSDTQTGLMWEKKTTAVGSGPNYADPHDVDNTYTWTASGSPYPADGTVFTDFLVKLNTMPCFAGHCDWRLPSEEGQNSPFTGPKELEGLLIHQCGANPCDDIIFAPVAFFYWSATTYAGSPSFAWGVGNGNLYSGFKTGNFYVRAVRTGP